MSYPQRHERCDLSAGVAPLTPFAMLLAERELIARALERTIADKNTEAEAAARRCLDWLDAEICNAGIEC